MEILKTPVIAAGFSSLTEARGFKGAEDNKTFSMEGVFTREAGLAFVDMLQEKANKLHAQEIERSKAKGKSVRYALPIINYKELDDGRIRLTFKRREDAKPPVAVDKDNNPITSFVRRDSAIEVAFSIKPYVMANVFGVTLQLLGVKVLDSAMSAATVEDLFGAAPPKTEVKPVAVEDLF